MMQNTVPIRARKPSEDGYMLLVAIFLLALLVLSLSVAAPRVAKSIQRDREVETMHRGKQFKRAIQLYYRKFNAYPPSEDALVNTNNIRFLRKKYIDPMTGKDDWKPIMFGQNKTPLAMGFFGQPLGGVSGQPIAGTGPSGTGGMPGASGFGSNTGGSSFGGSSFGSGGSSTGSSFGSGTGGSIFGSSNTGTTDSGSTGSTGSSSGSTGTTGSAGGTDANGNPTSGTGSGFMSGQTGQTLGGGIIGFEPASPKQSILTLKKKNHYNEWEFTYSPLQDMQTQAGGNAGTIGTPVGNGTGTSTPGFGGTNNTFGGSSFGGNSGSGLGSSPTQPSTPTQSQPQQ
jgi:type II secretory pathway pseudopilin PulG